MNGKILWHQRVPVDLSPELSANPENVAVAYVGIPAIIYAPFLLPISNEFYMNLIYPRLAKRIKKSYIVKGWTEPDIIQNLSYICLVRRDDDSLVTIGGNKNEYLAAISLRLEFTRL